MKNKSSFECKAIESQLPSFSYIFVNGPWRNCLIRYGFDPRTTKEAAQYQVLQVRSSRNRSMFLKPTIHKRMDRLSAAVRLQGNDEHTKIRNRQSVSKRHRLSTSSLGLRTMEDQNNDSSATMMTMHSGTSHEEHEDDRVSYFLGLPVGKNHPYITVFVHELKSDAEFQELIDRFQLRVERTDKWTGWYSRLFIHLMQAMMRLRISELLLANTTSDVDGFEDQSLEILRRKIAGLVTRIESDNRQTLAASNDDLNDDLDLDEDLDEDDLDEENLEGSRRRSTSDPQQRLATHMVHGEEEKQEEQEILSRQKRRVNKKRRISPSGSTTKTTSSSYSRLKNDDNTTHDSQAPSNDSSNYEMVFQV